MTEEKFHERFLKLRVLSITGGGASAIEARDEAGELVGLLPATALSITLEPPDYEPVLTIRFEGETFEASIVAPPVDDLDDAEKSAGESQP